MGSNFGKNVGNFCFGYIESEVPVGHLIEIVLK